MTRLAEEIGDTCRIVLGTYFCGVEGKLLLFVYFYVELVFIYDDEIFVNLNC